MDRCEEAEIRDYRALERDLAAELRDAAVAERDAADAGHDDAPAETAKEPVFSATAARARAAMRRAENAASRELAAADRASAAADRELAMRDRLTDFAGLDALAHHLEERAPGEPAPASAESWMQDIEYELRRCQRPDSLLAIASMAIHAVPAPQHGDRVADGGGRFRRTVACLSEQLGRYDLLIRRGPGALVWAMPDTALADARRRTDAIRCALAEDAATRRLVVGIAQRLPDDSATDLVARADRELERQYDSSG